MLKTDVYQKKGEVGFQTVQDLQDCLNRLTLQCEDWMESPTSFNAERVLLKVSDFTSVFKTESRKYYEEREGDKDGV